MSAALRFYPPPKKKKLCGQYMSGENLGIIGRNPVVFQYKGHFTHELRAVTMKL